MNAEVEYAIGRVMKVRRLAGKFQVIDSWIVGGAKHRRRRYKLFGVKETGALLEFTEAFAEDMEPVPESNPVEELTLVPDPDTDETTPVIRARTAAQEHDAPNGHPVPAPDAAQPAADAISGRIFTPEDAFGLDPGAFGGELDPYSPGANRLDDPGELKNPFEPVRKLPRRPTYRELRGIVYSARFKGLEDWSEVDLSKLPDETPVAVAVTHETNGHAIWIISMDAGQAHSANLEIFYPEGRGSSADALEYAVLLALRQVPIRSQDLEELLLALAS
jgi:hypothetical protein